MRVVVVPILSGEMQLPLYSRRDESFLVTTRKGERAIEELLEQ